MTLSIHSGLSDFLDEQHPSLAKSIDPFLCEPGPDINCGHRHRHRLLGWFLKGPPRADNPTA